MLFEFELKCLNCHIEFTITVIWYFFFNLRNRSWLKKLNIEAISHQIISDEYNALSRHKYHFLLKKLVLFYKKLLVFFYKYQI